MALPDADSVKMFVGQIPRTMDEDELRKLMEEFGSIYQLGIIRDRASGHHKGRCTCCVCMYMCEVDLTFDSGCVLGIKCRPHRDVSFSFVLAVT